MMHETTKVLVVGANGQLGKEIQKLSKRFGDWIFIFSDRQEIDITDEGCIQKICEINPDYIINCAAYTAVDKAETEPEQADDINNTGCAHLASAAANTRAILIHISTDYVYNMNPGTPLKESDSCAPRGVYACTKYDGERKIEAWPQHIIVRTSWVYGCEGKNFYKTMLALRTKPELKIVSDQYGAPTYAADLANFILHVIESLESVENKESYYGIYNFSNEGFTTWYDFAQCIFDLNGVHPHLIPITTEEFGAPAHRPSWSVLSKQKVKNKFNYQVPHWLDGLKRCVSEQKGD